MKNDFIFFEDNIIGDSYVGKSNLLIRYAYGEFKEEYQTTIGVEFGVKNERINDKIYRVQIWDTAGQENFKSIIKGYYKNSACAIITYDITNRQSFNNLIDWIDDCRNLSPKTIYIVLVGNKSDLENERKVSTEEGKELAEKYGFIFFETSAKTGENVNEVFLKSVNEITKRINDGLYNLDDENCGIRMRDSVSKTINNIQNDPGNKKKKNCCI